MWTMERMTIRLVSARKKEGKVLARLRAEAPGIGTRAWLEVKFEIPANSRRGDWMQEAYDRALRMLDLA